MKRLHQEERAMSNYVKKKEVEDAKEEQRRKENLKKKELDTKRTLDI